MSVADSEADTQELEQRAKLYEGERKASFEERQNQVMRQKTF